MSKKSRWGWVAAALVILVSVFALSQGQIKSLVVSGYAGAVPVTQMNGGNYVSVEALARALNGSLSFKGNQVVLALAGSGEATANPAPPQGFSRQFLNAGIEQMSMLREWHSALQTAIENQYPVTAASLQPYSARARTNLRLAQTAATTDDDQKAVQFLSTEYDRMKQLSDKYVAMRVNMTAIPPDALDNDSLNQSLVACGRALGAMAANGQFVDDSNCH